MTRHHNSDGRRGRLAGTTGAIGESLPGDGATAGCSPTNLAGARGNEGAAIGRPAGQPAAPPSSSGVWTPVPMRAWRTVTAHTAQGVVWPECERLSRSGVARCHRPPPPLLWAPAWLVYGPCSPFLGASLPGGPLSIRSSSARDWLKSVSPAQGPSSASRPQHLRLGVAVRLVGACGALVGVGGPAGSWVGVGFRAWGAGCLWQPTGDGRPAP